MAAATYPILSRQHGQQGYCCQTGCLCRCSCPQSKTIKSCNQSPQYSFSASCSTYPCQEPRQTSASFAKPFGRNFGGASSLTNVLALHLCLASPNCRRFTHHQHINPFSLAPSLICSSCCILHWTKQDDRKCCGHAMQAWQRSSS